MEPKNQYLIIVILLLCVGINASRDDGTVRIVCLRMFNYLW